MDTGTSAVADPADLGVLAAAALLRSGGLSAAELLAACQQRIAERNGGPPSFDGAPGAVNAWIRLYPELAQDLARAADQRLARDATAAPLLCGIPVGLKDLFAVGGLPVTASSRVLEQHVARRSSTAWERLADAGMVLAGHTHTHEFAAGGTTDQVGIPGRWTTLRAAPAAGQRPRWPAAWSRPRWAPTPRVRCASRRRCAGCARSSPPMA